VRQSAPAGSGRMLTSATTEPARRCRILTRDASTRAAPLMARARCCFTASLPVRVRVCGGGLMRGVYGDGRSLMRRVLTRPAAYAERGVPIPPV